MQPGTVKKIKCTYSLSSALRFALTRGYTTEKRPQADVLEVNQSPANNNKFILTLTEQVIFF